MDKEIMKIRSNTPIVRGVYAMTLEGDCRDIEKPGRFINIKTEGFFLRRPISICTWTPDSLTLLYKVVGGGTEILSQAEPGRELDVLMPLGNGFNIADCKEKPLLIGGGIGTPPLLGLAEKLIEERGITPQVVMGYRSAEEVVLTHKFRDLGIEPVIATEDGSEGFKGYVTDAARNLDFDYVYSCGPIPMLKSVYTLDAPGQYSFEARMACGFGACMGCSVMTKAGPKRICKEGPVLYKEELPW